MSNPVWAKIWIGGELKRSLIPDLEKCLTKDIFGGNDGSKVKFDCPPGLDFWECEDESIGTFEETEKFLYKNSIPFIRDTGQFDDFMPETKIFIPGVIDEVYITSLSGEVIIFAVGVMGLHEAIKTVTFQNAALMVNSSNQTVKEYASYLLKGGDPMEFVKAKMGKFTPSYQPKLPTLKIIEDKPKRKKK